METLGFSPRGVGTLPRHGNSRPPEFPVQALPSLSTATPIGATTLESLKGLLSSGTPEEFSKKTSLLPLLGTGRGPQKIRECPTELRDQQLIYRRA